MTKGTEKIRTVEITFPTIDDANSGCTKENLNYSEAKVPCYYYRYIFY